MSLTNQGLIIESLSLKNFATFEDQVINFSTGFNAIIGETGSGKSLILDALQLIFGQRADKKIIRKDCDFSIIETIFRCNDSKIITYCEELGFPFDHGEIVIKRILYKSGRTKSFLNHQACSLNILISFSKKYIDLVGQFENQKLLSSDYQIKLLDSYSGISDLLNTYQNTYYKLQATQKELQELNKASAERSQKIDYISFQLDELKSLSPSLEKETSLIKEKCDFQNFSENKNNILLLNNIFEGNNLSQGLLAQLSQVESILDPKLFDSKTLSNFLNAKELLNDINFQINTSNTNELDEERLEEVLSELDAYQRLKRKFNVSTEGLAELYTQFRNELDSLMNIDDKLSDLTKTISELQSSAFKMADKLHIKRVSSASKLNRRLTKEIRLLNMHGATISIDLIKTEFLTLVGHSKINFCAETNPGEGYFKIKDIASGGELSRILLSLRKTLSANDSISIFLFDEIDSGIGGETAIAVGKTLYSVSSQSQVIAITHLPQIANYATKLIVVSKDQIVSDKKSRTISAVAELEGAMIKKEISSMSIIH